MSANAYEGQTFAPSSTRETATEVTVRSSEETTNVDIKFREVGGHQVSGSIKAPITTAGSRQQFIVMLSPVPTSMPAMTSFQAPGSMSFSFSGVSEGTYDLIAQSTINPDESFLSDPYRIIVKGGDVTGIELIPKPMASITGKLVLEPSQSAECKGKRRPIFTETLVVPVLNMEKIKKDEVRPMMRLPTPTVPDADGIG